MNDKSVVEDVKQTILFNAPIQKVWDKVATAEGLQQWFMPNDFQPQAGYEFHLQSPFGPSPCKVLEIDAPNYLSFSWDTDGWVVSFTLKEMDNQTEFTLIHSGWKEAETLLKKANEKSSVVRDRMSYGWTSLMNEKLRKVVEN
ncbi:SRPBCC domain-containing protein [Bacillus megaterium]|uniref:SRPBCC family protein n=1 Tax=Priestia megaterium TaxID=1404 RepID=UPI001293D18C|nr:SRPBCC domain-containing protein [Priestia megaterium]MQR86682.1 SRPBCC domain-containing protein [Priestia megaterium]